MTSPPNHPEHHKKTPIVRVWGPINPDGTLHLDMNTHLDLGPVTKVA